MDFKYLMDARPRYAPRDEGVAARFPDEDVYRLICVPEWVKRQRSFRGKK
jgi:hypothetical protein